MSRVLISKLYCRGWTRADSSSFFTELVTDERPLADLRIGLLLTYSLINFLIKNDRMSFTLFNGLKIVKRRAQFVVDATELGSQERKK